MAEPVKKDDALAAAVREAFQRHMENARLAALSGGRSSTGHAPRPERIVSVPDEEEQVMTSEAKSGSTAVEDGRADGDEDRRPHDFASSLAADLHVQESASAEAALAQPTLEEESADAKPRLPTVGTSRADQRISAPVVREPLPSSTLPADPALAATQTARGSDAQAIAVTTDRPPVVRTGEIVPAGRRRPPTRPGGDLPQIGAEARYSPAPPSRGEASRYHPVQERAPERQLAPPSPANDREIRLRAARAREREQLAAFSGRPERPAPRREALVTTHALEPPQDLDPGTHPATPEPASSRGRRPAPRSRDADNANFLRESRFGSGGKAEERARTTKRWIIFILAMLVGAAAVGAAAYVWLLPVGHNLAVPLPDGKSDAVAPPAAPGPSSMAPESGPSRTVKTTAIKLNSIDLALQDARERIVSGDIPAARAILERFREAGDARTLVGLAETYDPSIVPDATYADARQAQLLYEAAGRAGFPGTADRLARLQFEPPQ